MKTNIISILLLLVFPAIFNAQEPAGNWERTWELKPGIYKVMQQGMIGVVNADGEILIPCQFDQVYNLTADNYVKVLKNLKTGIYHFEKGIIVPAEYDQVWSFEGEKAKILKDGKTGYVNRDGLIVIPVEYSHIWPEEDGLIKVMKDGKMGLLSTDGAIVLPADYQQIWSFTDGRAKVLKNGKMGYIDSRGNELIPPVYTQLQSFNNGIAKAWTGTAAVYIDTLGRTVDPPAENTAMQATSNGTETENSRVEINRGGNHQEIIIRHDDSFEKKPRKPNYHFRGNLDGINIGINSYLNSNYRETVPGRYSFMDVNHERSFEISIYPFQHSIRLIGSHVGLASAIGLRFNNYRFNLYNSNELTGNEAAQSWFPKIEENASIEKAKLTLLSLDVPLMLEIHLPDGRNRNGLYLAGGAVGSLKLNTHTKVIYNSDGIDYKRKQFKDIGLNVFRYTFMVRAGYRTFGIYATYSPMPLFKENKDPELYPYSVGMSINF